MPGKIHTAKWDSCLKKVMAQGKSKEAAAAICTASLGEEGSITSAHRRKAIYNLPTEKSIIKKHNGA